MRTIVEYPTASVSVSELRVVESEFGRTQGSHYDLAFDLISLLRGPALHHIVGGIADSLSLLSLALDGCFGENNGLRKMEGNRDGINVSVHLQRRDYPREVAASNGTVKVSVGVKGTSTTFFWFFVFAFRALVLNSSL